MSAVLDTSVLIDVLRGQRGAVQYLLSLPARPVCSEVSRVEILRGVRSSERVPTIRLLASLDWHPVEAEVAELAGRWGRRYRRSHPGVGVADLCIAATAQVLRLPLATGNIRHFPMFAGLEAAYPGSR
jgi:predicted nucleic acid-binding protein